MITMASNTPRATTLVICSLLLGCAPHPPDESLRVRFFQHEASFEKLVRIAPNFTWPENTEVPLSCQRWDEYRVLFRELGIEFGISRRDDVGVMLIVNSVGMISRGTSKGYAYSTEQLDPIVASLDEKGTQPCGRRKDCIAFKRLKNNWYLFYEIA